MNRTTTKTITYGNGQSQSAKRRRAKAQAKARNMSSKTSRNTRTRRGNVRRQRQGKQGFGLYNTAQYTTDPADWLAGLKNPNISGIKIPDPMSLMPTGTLQIEQDTIFTTLADGSFCLVLDPYGGTYAWAQTGTNTAATFSYSSMTGYSNIIQNFSTFRLVSAQIEATFIGSTSADQGLAFGFEIDSILAKGAVPPNFGLSLGAYSDCQQWPLRNGMRVLWVPRDTSTATYFTQPAGYGAAAYFGQSANPLIGYAILGGAASAMTVSLRITCNYEGLPRTDAENILSLSPSPNHPTHWARAWAFATDVSSHFAPIFGGWSQATNVAAQFLGAAMSNSSTLRVQGNPKPSWQRQLDALTVD